MLFTAIAVYNAIDNSGVFKMVFIKRRPFKLYFLADIIHVFCGKLPIFISGKFYNIDLCYEAVSFC